MRQSVKYTRKASKAEPQAPEHDPMDDWDMEELLAAGRRSPARLFERSAPVRMRIWRLWI